MSSSFTSTQFPAEIWGQVAACMPEADQRTLLFVSRFHRRVARSLLFQRLRLEFGIWERINVDAFLEDQSLDDLLIKNTTRSKNILRYILEDHEFAQGIRRLWIFCYTNTGFDQEESDLLIQALRTLPHLQDFFWFGTFPRLTSEVVHTLNLYCTQLTGLRLPASQDTHLVPALRLRNLSSLFIECRLFIDNISGYFPEKLAELRQDFSDLIGASYRLTKLTVYGDLLGEVAFDRLEQLTHLEIWNPHSSHAPHFDQIVRHAHGLTDLALVELTGCQEILPILLNEPENFVALKRLKIMSMDAIHEATGLSRLTACIRAHPQLQRLDLDLPGLVGDDVFKLLEAISELTELRVLGFDLRSLNDQDHMAEVASYIPRSLIALHLEHCWDNVPIEDDSMQHLLACLTEMPMLEILHIQTEYASPQTAAEDLAYVLPSLQIIGLAEHIYSVVRHTQNKKFLLSLRPWSYRETALRTQDTIGEHGEWLLRFHNLLEVVQTT